MKNRLLQVIGLTTLFLLGSCAFIDDFSGGKTDDLELKFVDEFVIPDDTMFQNTLIGGLSGIDYALGTWYLIADDPNNARFYNATISYDMDGFIDISINGVNELLDNTGSSFGGGTVDPEAIRFDNGNLVWTSEGNINNGVDPFVRVANLTGAYVSGTNLPSRYQAFIGDAARGPRQNGTFEGITLSYDKMGYWVTMELPLVEDGPAPTTQDTDSPIRISYIDRASGNFGKEFAYELDPVVRPAANGSTFELNGVVELLQYDEEKFLFLERSFSTGYDYGGNNVKIYDVDISDATDVSGVEALVNADFTVASKKLLFDFETIRNQLTEGVVDNIEGITFGPDFPNGNKSVVLVADNNFSAFGPQLNQFVLFELLD
ncbi:esterase-like activity of phytase family protein [Flagellimonas meridianipacifica]|uniref:Phytase-like domain-containing protein n=1 Tax=Flagellimonas meridianipacifica TaxID=1080225 RepID=A0A2T0MG42_9FLAO|nr:esterase-like activity of phytase family protein [Allomuricauda pacifica]PRX56557.1 hypothetical protein CLV81_0554 [Allomuricauda pacifica]